MRSFNKDEYRGQFPFSEFRIYGNAQSWSAGPKMYCSCTRYIGHEAKAWESCPNCLGFGEMPIPWSEL